MDCCVEGLHSYVTHNGVTVRGEIPVSIMMGAVRELAHDSFHVQMDDSDILGCPASAWRD